MAKIKIKPKTKYEIISLYLKQLKGPSGRIVVYYDNNVMARDMIKDAGFTPVPWASYREIYQSRKA